MRTTWVSWGTGRPTIPRHFSVRSTVIASSICRSVSTGSPTRSGCGRIPCSSGCSPVSRRSLCPMRHRPSKAWASRRRWSGRRMEAMRSFPASGWPPAASIRARPRCCGVPVRIPWSMTSSLRAATVRSSRTEPDSTPTMRITARIRTPPGAGTASIPVCGSRMAAVAPSTASGVRTPTPVRVSTSPTPTRPATYTRFRWSTMSATRSSSTGFRTGSCSPRRPRRNTARAGTPSRWKSAILTTS